MEREEIETLITKKDISSYENACDQVRWYMGHDFTASDKIAALEYAIEKAKFFAKLDICVSDGFDCYDVESFCLIFSNLYTNIMWDLAECNPSRYMSFAEEILALTCNKWPHVSGEIIEDIFYEQRSELPLNSKKAFDDTGVLVDKYLSTNSDKMGFLDKKIEVSAEKFFEKYSVVHNMISVAHGFESASQVRENAVIFGKKYVELFFSMDQNLLESGIIQGFDELKKLFDKHHEDDSQESLIEEKLRAGSWCGAIYDAIFLNDKNALALAELDICATIVSSIALSVSLLMNKEDGIIYLNSFYKKLIQNEYTRVAEGLKEYVINPPKTKDEEDDGTNSGLYSVINPASFNDKFILIPGYLKKAFVD